MKKLYGKDKGKGEKFIPSVNALWPSQQRRNGGITKMLLDRTMKIIPGDNTHRETGVQQFCSLRLAVVQQKPFPLGQELFLVHKGGSNFPQSMSMPSGWLGPQNGEKEPQKGRCGEGSGRTQRHREAVYCAIDSPGEEVNGSQKKENN